MRYLVVTDSVHATAAACDYIEGRLGADDTVTVVAVGDDDTRDAADALNVANARLVGAATVEVEQVTGEDDPASAALDAADESGAEEIVLGRRVGASEGDPSLPETVRDVADRATVPVVVVPGQP